MGEFYGKKIKKEEINPRTGLMWNLMDVPLFWRGKVEKWILENL